MNGIEIFPWNENFNCGISVIDAQHRQLVKLINGVASHLAYGTDEPALDEVVAGLADYAVNHFRTEEGVWRQYFPDDPLEVEHRKSHLGFSVTVARFREKIARADPDGLYEESLSYLIHWLVSHILENDRYLAAIALDMERGMSLPEAKHHAAQGLASSSRVLIELVLAIYDSLSANTLSLIREIRLRKAHEGQIRQHAERLEKVFLDVVNLATTMAELRDPYTVGHEKRVAELSVAIGKELGLDADQLQGIRVGAHLHDLGKVAIPLEILNKPGRIDPVEMEMVKLHPLRGYEILKNIEFPWPIDQMALQHHERMDGSGYPGRKQGEEILLEARIIAVADVVEAMSSHRPYRPGLGIEMALKEIRAGRGRLYDPVIADACSRLFMEKNYSIPGG